MRLKQSQSYRLSLVKLSSQLDNLCRWISHWGSLLLHDQPSNLYIPLLSKLTGKSQITDCRLYLLLQHLELRADW